MDIDLHVLVDSRLKELENKPWVKAPPTEALLCRLAERNVISACSLYSSSSLSWTECWKQTDSAPESWSTSLLATENRQTEIFDRMEAQEKNH